MGRCALLCSFAGLAVAAAACADARVVTNSFATLAEARRAGAVQRGEVPDGLPDGATDLRSAYDPDTRRRWGLFSFPQSQGDTLRLLLRADDAPLTGVRVDIPRRIEWWPVLLRGALDEERIKATGLRAYRSQRDGLLFLVNWEQGRAYYWAFPPSEGNRGGESKGPPGEGNNGAEAQS